MREPDAPILADSITRLGPEAAEAVVVTGSHGGVYAAWLARKAGCRAVIFNDAGVGRDEAGIGGLAWLDAHGMAAAAIDHRSADIGAAMVDGRRRHAVCVEPGEPADPGLVTPHPGIVEDHRAASRLAGEPGGIDAAMRPRHHHRLGSFRAEAGDAVGEDRGIRLTQRGRPSSPSPRDYRRRAASSPDRG